MSTLWAKYLELSSIIFGKLSFSHSFLLPFLITLVLMITFCVCFCNFPDHTYEQFYGKGKKNKITHKKMLSSHEMKLTREGENLLWMLDETIQVIHIKRQVYYKFYLVQLSTIWWETSEKYFDFSQTLLARATKQFNTSCVVCFWKNANALHVRSFRQC